MEGEGGESEEKGGDGEKDGIMEWEKKGRRGRGIGRKGEGKECERGKCILVFMKRIQKHNQVGNCCRGIVVVVLFL